MAQVADELADTRRATDHVLVQVQLGNKLNVLSLFRPRPGAVRQRHDQLVQYSTLGSLPYADVPPALASRASSLSAMSVLLTIGISVGAAAAVLGVILQWRKRSKCSAGNNGWAIYRLSTCLTSASPWSRAKGRKGPRGFINTTVLQVDVGGRVA